MRRRSRVHYVILIGSTGFFLIALAFALGFLLASIQPSKSFARTPSDAAELRFADSSLQLFREAWDLIAEDFFGPLPSNRQMVYGAVRGLLGTLADPYTVLIEPVPHQFEQDDLRGSYGGVGMTLNRDADGQVVLSPMRDSPAAQVGIRDGDILLAVDDLQITPELDISADIAARIRGKVGTDVTLTIQRGDTQLSFTITREVIETPSVTWRTLEQSPGLAYIQIGSFTDRTAGELKLALQELLAEDPSGLILDLRNNGGGLLQSSLDVADQFLNGGTVLHERRQGQEEKTYVASHQGQALEIPLVVLVNHGTASASEIVAGSIQDRERGILVGEATFGKGSVQLIFDLSDGSSLHVTAARWYTPNRHQLDGVGLTPDLTVVSEVDNSEDIQLERAIRFLETGK